MTNPDPSDPSDPSLWFGLFSSVFRITAAGVRAGGEAKSWCQRLQDEQRTSKDSSKDPSKDDKISARKAEWTVRQGNLMQLRSSWISWYFDSLDSFGQTLQNNSINSWWSGEHSWGRKFGVVFSQEPGKSGRPSTTRRQGGERGNGDGGQQDWQWGGWLQTVCVYRKHLQTLCSNLNTVELCWTILSYVQLSWTIFIFVVI